MSNPKIVQVFAGSKLGSKPAVKAHAAPAPPLSGANALLNTGRRSPRADIASAG
jgi:hypothetical protein